MRTSGNLALNPAYRPAYQPTQTALRKKADVSTGANRNKAKQQKKLNLFVALIYIAVIFAVALCLVTREVRLYEKSNTVNALQTNLENAVTETKQAMVASERAIDLGTVETAAVTKYRMSKPQKNQTIYINVRQDDYVETTADKHVGASLLDGIGAVFGIFAIQ